jgi:16S rRNA (guanine527-N7)-methyltransferase
MVNKDVIETLELNLKFTKEDIEKLHIFHDELLAYNKKYNLISKSTELDIWNRHIFDSAQLVNYINFKENKSISDIGTGAGFPGIVLAIFNKNKSFHVKLYEKSNVKCDFLDIIRKKIDVDYDIFGDYKNEIIDSEYVVSRAFKKLEETLRISREIIKVNHKLIILKGRNALNEINKLKPNLNFIYRVESSMTDPDSKILIIEIKK